MDVAIQPRPAQRVAYIRVAGPYAETMPEGFSRLCRWAESRHLQGGDWLAFYWDDPHTTPLHELRADVALSVPAEIEGEGEVQIQQIPAALYACHRCRVTDGDFSAPWNRLFQEWLPTSGYQAAAGPCFEHYLNDGRQDGYWELLIGTPVQPR